MSQVSPMSEPKPVLRWVSRVEHESVEETITEFSAEHIAVYVAVTAKKTYYEVWLPESWFSIDATFADIDEALLYVEKIIAETDPEFYLQQILSAEVPDV